jgi:hypothetical protein
MPTLRILFYNGSLVTWTVASLTTAKFKPLIFPMSRFALSYTMNIFILMILFDFCLSPAQFCYKRIIVYIRKVEAVCKSRTGVHLGKFPVVRRTLFCRRCNFKRWGFFVCNTSPCCIAPARTVQKTSIPLLHVLSLPGKSVHRAVP